MLTLRYPVLALVVALTAMPATAGLRVSVQAFTALGVPEARARCIVARLGEGAQLDEAGEEDSEGELDSVLEKLRSRLGKMAALADRDFYRTVAAQAFQSQQNRDAFIDIATRQCAPG
ncbi:hypothetical protein CAP39_08075 [Sphingomonas sp. IBVSS1]|uniref:Uncharacterized protein n=1 Tax=Sandarakinorhabdus cyanobacteriorum TaxID=1981098 RepID=A0A255YGI0_9SPHN|nr:hypothetical protein [Sandarakinorhabdus cyanobacteriorum]OSZ70888.1 hypothetical protein CAP39_08075 [Sphingomonas sp. IBVSS1]OYQ28288.1 hypothetical protein CHU93_09250 [Sandarakinorhabdus cyanobacteriorum]